MAKEKVEKVENQEVDQEVDQEVEQEVTEQPVEGGVPESVSLNDLQLLANIVDLASQRGAFRGAELTQVGAVFDKLQAFLGFVAKQQQERAEQEESETEEAQS